MDLYSQLRRFGVLDTHVPRYTSYPPTPHFTDTVGAMDYGRWLARIPEGSEVSLYIHIPFCQRLCWFCSARTQGAPGGAPVASYVDTLIREARAVGAALPPGVRARSVYWGGGTPTILSPADITRLSCAVHSAIPLTNDAEITVEVDPTEIDDARMDALAQMGMTRASIGVQDFDPEIQKIIGRAQSFEATKAAIDGLRARGVDGLTMGLLYGLPKQRRTSLARLTQLLLTLSPDRVTVQPYAHVPAIARRQSLIPTADLPTPEGQLALFDAAAGVLRWDGFDPIGIDHFALPSDALSTASSRGDLRRCFQGYTDNPGGVLLGLGASAVSRLPQGYAQNAPGTSAYLKAVAAGRFATARGHRLSKDDALRGRMIEMILCDFRIDIAKLLAERLGPVARIEDLLTHMLRQFPGQIARFEGGLRVRANSKAMVRVIARALDAYAP
ncbi:radical SAM protein [Jannaschia sp. CCS1]|uniref:radical SAM protein n=1 Tax=Jannaschia sp. (strain CCS1) TaxID=290400 RepID=UPI000053CBA9|nr:radical SAM protein [Jannaschia sp. CCS1]ABD56776.1 oxygen-independent coproporphyrinogen III oxidase [Jannaschia sp. CCS1]